MLVMVLLPNLGCLCRNSAWFGDMKLLCVCNLLFFSLQLGHFVAAQSSRPHEAFGLWLVSSLKAARGWTWGDRSCFLKFVQWEATITTWRQVGANVVTLRFFRGRKSCFWITGRGADLKLWDFWRCRVWLYFYNNICRYWIIHQHDKSPLKDICVVSFHSKVRGEADLFFFPFAGLEYPDLYNRRLNTRVLFLLLAAISFSAVERAPADFGPSE